MPTPRRHENAAARQRAYRKRRKLAQTSELNPKDLPKQSRLPAMPSTARWRALRQQAEAALKTLQDEMESYQNQRSEVWQEGANGEAFRQALERVDEAIDAVQNIE